MCILWIAQDSSSDAKGSGQHHVLAMSRDQVTMSHDVTAVTT